MINIIGIDCATQPKNTGLAFARANGTRIEVLTAFAGSSERPPAAVVADWIRGNEKTLLALDAPLGWPRPLAIALKDHRAGDPLNEADGHKLFRRLTDRRIQAVFDKTPLEVGANLIARTAHAALKLLAEVLCSTGQEIPLAWTPSFAERVAAIEVYPAATCCARDVRNRAALLQMKLVEICPESDCGNPHVGDAVACVIAGADFLRGEAVEPDDGDRELAKAEGWIWVRPREPR